MKKIVIPFLLALCLFTEANAQLEKSTILVSGFGTYTKSKEDNGDPLVNNRRFYSISPVVGYFLTDKLVVGLEARYSNSYYQSESNSSPNIWSRSTSKERGYDIGPFVRYYVPINEKFAFFGQGSLMFGKSKNKMTYENNNFGTFVTTHQNTDYNNYRVGIAPGFSFFPTSKVALEVIFGNIGYNQYKTNFNNNQPNYKSNGFDIGLNLKNFSLGISFYL